MMETTQGKVAGLPERLRAEIVEIASRYPDVERVLLFGSRARGDARERSDVDLCIAAPDMPRRDWTHLSLDLDDMRTLLQIDVARLHEATGEFLRQIQKDGVVVYERECPLEPEKLGKRLAAVGGGGGAA